MAFEVADELQGQGLGTILLAHLAEAAEEQGVAIFEASVLPDNYRMAGVFRDSGFSVQMRSKPDLISVEMPTTISAEARRALRRAASAAAASRPSRSFFEPASVAVIGASRGAAPSAAEVFHNLLATGFNGPVLSR